MKFHAFALCLAGTLVASVAGYAQDNTGNTGNPPGTVGSTTPSNLSTSDSQMNHSAMRNSDMDGRHSGRHHRGDMDYNARDPYTGYSVYAGEHLYYRDVLYPDLPDIQSVAQKVSDITRMQNQEIAELRTLSPKAVTAGYENVHSVYEYMIDDHQAFVGFTDRWLTDRGFPVPPAPDTVAAVADVAPDQSVNRQIQEHEDMMNHALAMRQGEASSTVRTLLLWAATTSARHISLLRTLDSDISRGHKDLTARLRLQMAPGTMTAANTDQLFEQSLTEERQYFASLQPEQPEVTVTTEEETPAPVAQAPAPAPAPAPTTTAPAPAPAPTPAAQAPAPTTNNSVNTQSTGRSRVAGSRQNTGRYRSRTRSTRRGRRPAY